MTPTPHELDDYLAALTPDELDAAVSRARATPPAWGADDPFRRHREQLQAVNAQLLEQMRHSDHNGRPITQP